MTAIIGDEIARFRPSIDLYRQAGAAAGHSGALKVGVHALGFVADSDQAARDAFYPGWQYMFTKVGAERGWPPTTKAQFDQMAGRPGSFVVGSPETVIAKILAADRDLGGVDRITFQMSSAARPARDPPRDRLLGWSGRPLVHGD